MNESMRAAVLWRMRDEAFAFAEYSLFAEQARLGGHDELAVLFERAADVELHEHFAALADAYRLCGRDEENLQRAIHDASASRQGFAALARWAREAGEQALAAQCKEHEREEHSQMRCFEQALEELAVSC